MNEEHQPALLAAAAAGVAVVCCTLPLLLSAGVVTTLAGIGLRNWLIVLVGGGLSMFGLVRLLRCRRSCE